MPKLIFLALLCCLPSASLSAQDSGTDEYVTGMTVVGTPGAGPSCPLIVWFVEPDTPAAKTAIQPGDRVLAIDGHRGIDAAEKRRMEGRPGRQRVRAGRHRRRDEACGNDQGAARQRPRLRPPLPKEYGPLLSGIRGVGLAGSSRDCRMGYGR